MEHFDEGLRCQDVHSGLRNIDPSSPLLAPLTDTRLVGMAATTAGLIRGLDVVSDASALQTVAAAQLDVNPMAFNEVVEILERVGFVEGVKRKGGKVVSFNENVPYYNDLYVAVGEAWRDRSPTELEVQLLTVVDGLAHAPVALEELDKTFSLDSAALPSLLELGRGSGLVQTIRTVDGDVVYSPFLGFEQPERLGDLIDSHGTDRLVEEFAAVRARQGLELDPNKYPLLTQAVAGGLVMAPSVKLPDGTMQAFAALPYLPGDDLLKARKPVLEKALAVLACLRSAERYSENSTLTPAGLVNVINKLLDPNRGFLAPHQAHRRQYELVRNAGLIRFGPDTRAGGSWVTPMFIDTEDNRAALVLARDLITHGEMVSQRVDDSTARQALQGSTFTAPMQTMERMRTTLAPSPANWDEIIERAMGWGAK